MTRLERIRVCLERNVLVVSFDGGVRLPCFKTWALWWLWHFGVHPASFPDMDWSQVRKDWRLPLGRAVWRNILAGLEDATLSARLYWRTSPGLGILEFFFPRRVRWGLLDVRWFAWRWLLARLGVLFLIVHIIRGGTGTLTGNAF